MLNITCISVRLLMALVLGGLIGLQREGKNRPAGFRTHILVCMGAALIMLCGIFLFNNYSSFSNLDPARLGAQVISGIGFLGAGTIIKEGSTVKGLTTAASLWAVAGIGLAVGSGFYIGAIIATLLILITLIIFSKFEPYINQSKIYSYIDLSTINIPGQIGKIGTVLGNLNISIDNISMEESSKNHLSLELTITNPLKIPNNTIVKNLAQIEGIQSIEINHTK
ncbi:MgtC/SapB family protein [Abyssisolibacter fermentans]|uniref:MgtC/SapB family protein n=1 Tax=Abyssisolibacter fermentans TaxID=1766203 RepID=UPI0008365425|nr:MgtC/SapB family protein [Abyssisolibacter fermentans]